MGNEDSVVYRNMGKQFLRKNVKCYRQEEWGKIKFVDLIVRGLQTIFESEVVNS